MPVEIAPANKRLLKSTLTGIPTNVATVAIVPIPVPVLRALELEFTINIPSNIFLLVSYIFHEMLTLT